MSNHFSPGNVIRDRYEIQALIGQGGMSAVYRVADHRLPGRLCALKVMRAQPGDLLGGEDAVRRQFLAEASTLGRLDHPNLPKVSDYFNLDAYDCLVMDYVAGPDLNQRIAEARRHARPLPLADVLAWLDQLCDVLSYLHGQQPPIIHGDVKPANIKLTADDRIKLVDFGLVRPADPDDPRTLTGAGLRGLGSLPYAALEQYAGSRASIDPRSDLYSLGATLYHLVTNQAPASAHDRFLDPAALVPLRQLNPDLPPAVETAIMAAMQPHPKDRPVSVATWRKSLWRDLPDVTYTGPAMPGTERGMWAENRWYLLVAGVMVAVAVALTFWR